MKLFLGDCLDKLKEIEDNSVDSIVTDPPYGLAFMGKKWDYDVPSQAIWEECMRVLKPGGHILSFAGSRTYHRMAVRIEDAGFEIRDQIMWVYGSGFPKSHNIGKAVDKIEGNEREDLGKHPTINGTGKKWRKNGSEIEYVKTSPHLTKGNSEWEGWGTALKPAHEPIVMARKPLIGTVVDNVLEWGTGGINIDDSRISTDEDQRRPSKGGENGLNNTNTFKIREKKVEEQVKHNGRFPANIIFDEEAGKILDEQSGISKSSDAVRRNNQSKYSGLENGAVCYGKYGDIDTRGYADVGGASRFFYCPKTSKTDRNEGLEHLEDKLTQGMRANASPALVGDDESGRTTAKNNHPTVKPTDLMLYLIRLVTPKGGTTLDPFMGSGSTGKAAVRGGFDFIGIEREEEYMKIAEARIEFEKNRPFKPTAKSTKSQSNDLTDSKTNHNFW